MNLEQWIDSASAKAADSMNVAAADRALGKIAGGKVGKCGVELTADEVAELATILDELTEPRFTVTE